jgi:hypothetical protein
MSLNFLRLFLYKDDPMACKLISDTKSGAPKMAMFPSRETWEWSNSQL